MNSYHHLNILSLFVLSLLLLGCKAGNGEGLDQQGRPLEETPEVVLPETEPDQNIIQPTLSSIQEHVFTPLCASCHGGANPAAGQDLSTLEKSVANLINVQSSNALFKRVLPGSALESYLYLKITGNTQAGSRMPLGQPPLTQEQIEAIKLWIDDGALVPEIAGKMARVSRITQKMDNSSTHKGSNKSAILQMSIWFNQAMNFSGLSTEQLVIRVSNSTPFNEENSWLINQDRVSLMIKNDHLLNIALKSEKSHASGQRTMQITLNKNSISTITSLDGQLLDGDEDGIEGGEYRYEFSF